MAAIEVGAMILASRPVIVALLTRHAQAWIAASHANTAKQKLEADIAAQNAVMTDCLAGLRAFGLDTAAAGVWEFIQNEYSNEVLEALALVPSTTANNTPPPPSPMAPKPEMPNVPGPAKLPPLADLVRDRLREAGEVGSKAALIRYYIEKTYGVSIHEKSVGMTLYRLLKKRQVRRAGHTWFIVAQAMNPGVSAPGLEVAHRESEDSMRYV